MPLWCGRRLESGSPNHTGYVSWYRPYACGTLPTRTHQGIARWSWNQKHRRYRQAWRCLLPFCAWSHSQGSRHTPRRCDSRGWYWPCSDCFWSHACQVRDDSTSDDVPLWRQLSLACSRDYQVVQTSTSVAGSNRWSASRSGSLYTCQRCDGTCQSSRTPPIARRLFWFVHMQSVFWLQRYEIKSVHPKNLCN